MRSATWTSTFSHNRWKYGTPSRFSFRRKSLREEWEPGTAPIAERVQALREMPMRRESPLGFKIHTAAYPAELIDVVELLRADVDEWKIGRRLPGEPPPKAKVGQQPGFVDADTAVAYLRGMVREGLERYAAAAIEEMKVWSPNEKDAAKSEPRKGEG